MTRVALIALADGSYSVEDAAQSLTLARIVPTGNRCWLVISTPPTISVGGRFGGPYDAFMAVQAQVDPTVYITQDDALQPGVTDDRNEKASPASRACSQPPPFRVAASARANSNGDAAAR